MYIVHLIAHNYYNTCIIYNVYTYFNIVFRPLVQSNGFDLGYVGAQTAMDATAVNADEHSKIHIRPVRVCT